MKGLLLSFLMLSFYGFNQTNIQVTNPVASDVLHGNYNPLNFQASQVINQKSAIVNGINSDVNPDSLKSYILKLSTFYNRNSGSDTLSSSKGIGAARRWVFSKFQQFSSQNENRLLPSYLQFDQVICSQNQHRNILAVLPGSDTTNHQIILLEAHIDSRCAVLCDTACLAEGIEDNASGTALIIELARVMSKYSYKNTIVFMLTIAEEQGLYGANAFAQYAVNEKLPIKAVYNNDVIGGIICGQTSSAPSCPGLNDIDSLQVRFFSYGSFNSLHKQLSRFTKLQYKEELKSIVSVPMLLSIMSAEDRTGRGGDHIPFRQKGFTAMRFTSANEHGDASNGTGYTDRQHTSSDILGIDTDSNGSIDSFFVDFNYLGRNAVINGVSSSLAALGPKALDFTIKGTTTGGLEVNIQSTENNPQYRVAIRTLTNDWDSVYTLSTTLDTIFLLPATNYFVSVAAVSSEGIESLFSKEIAISQTQIGILELKKENRDIELLQNKPNPFDEVTTITVKINQQKEYKNAHIIVRDELGKIVRKLPLELNQEFNEVNFEHGYGKRGVYSYSLVIDGKEIERKQMIFAN